jgi:hypothetical protein
MTTGTMRVLWGVGSLGTLVSAGCAQVLDVDTDRHVVPLEAGAAPWDCLGSPREKLDPNLDVDLTLVVMDAIQSSTSAGAVDGGSDLDTVSGTWLPGVSVRACALRDTGCGDGTPAAMTNDAGKTNLHLTGDFAGFFDIRRPDLVPSTLYPGNLLAGQSTTSFPAYGIRPDDFVSLALFATNSPPTLDQDGGLGHVIVTIYDCQDHQAPGVTLTYDSRSSQTEWFYFQNGLPNQKATQTDSYGLAGALNVPVGSLAVRAFLPPPRGTDAGASLYLGMTTVDVRAGSLTFAWIRTRTH